MMSKNRAQEFIHKYRFNAKKIQSLTAMTEIATQMGFEIYRPSGTDDEIIHALNLDDVLTSQPVFTYSDSDIHFIFVHQSFSDGMAAKMLLHEFGHIFLGHLNERQMPSYSDEAEANMFVDSVLKAIYKNNKPNVASIIIAVIGIMSFLMSVNISNKYQNAIEPVSSTYLSESTYMQAENESVFVTKNGTKYHKADCYHIKDSDVIELTVSEAEATGYEACKDCF